MSFIHKYLFFPKFGGFFSFLKQLLLTAGPNVVQRNMPIWQGGIFNYVSDRMSASWTLLSDTLLSYKLILTVRPDGPY